MILSEGGFLNRLVSLAVDSEVVFPELREILKDEEVADFFRYVARNDLRAEALELLEKRMGEME